MLEQLKLLLDAAKWHAYKLRNEEELYSITAAAEELVSDLESAVRTAERIQTMTAEA